MARRTNEQDGLRASGVKGFVAMPEGRAGRYRELGLWVDETLGELFSRAAVAYASRLAVADSRGGLTYAELEARAQVVARGLRARGCEAGDRVLLQVPNSVDFALALLGALHAGTIPVMCLPGHREAELSHYARSCGAVAFLTVERAGQFDYPALGARVVPQAPSLRQVLTLAEAEEAGTSAGLVEFGRPDPEGPALLLISGGTTGLPKLIPRTHSDYGYDLRCAVRACGLSGSDVYLVALPAAHNFPLANPGMLGSFLVGAGVVFAEEPSPETAFELVERHGATITALTPPLVQLWAAATAWEPADIGSLQVLQVGGSRIEPGQAQAAQEALGVRVQQVFGMAEGLICLTGPEDPEAVALGTQGRPMSEHDEVRLVDERGAEVPEGEVGEVECRGPYTISGYFNAPEANALAFTEDGFFRSGDLARRLPSGHLVVVGRIKNVINRGGETISAEEVEGHLLAHPGIREAVVVGRADELVGERICAAAVFHAAPLALGELRGFLAERGLSAEKHPEQLLVLDSLPTTAAGKLDRRAIAARLDQHA